MNKGETVSNRLLFEKEKIKVGSFKTWPIIKNTTCRSMNFIFRDYVTLRVT